MISTITNGFNHRPRFQPLPTVSTVGNGLLACFQPTVETVGYGYELS
ncbi:MAG: hypothetical protein PHC28_03275 [Flavobacterium sp.]|nr:hypothetical protein [Flavobacterium sp.]MDD5149490.1 hypothetical protein [Flavobacterium sp.]